MIRKYAATDLYLERPYRAVPAALLPTTVAVRKDSDGDWIIVGGPWHGCIHPKPPNEADAITRMLLAAEIVHGLYCFRVAAPCEQELHESSKPATRPTKKVPTRPESGSEEIRKEKRWHEDPPSN